MYRLETRSNPTPALSPPVSGGERFLTGIIFIFASGVFDPRIIPQLGSFKLNDFIIAPCCFIGILVLFNSCGPALRKLNWTRLWLFLMFYTFVGASIAWSSIPVGGFMRYVGLALISFWSLYLVLRYELRDIIKMLIWVFLGIAILSAFLAIFVPRIGLMHTALEFGDWSGVYRQKNTFGRQMMILCLLSAFMILNFKDRKIAPIALIIGLILVTLSGSRTAQGLTILGLFLILVIHFIKKPVVFSFLFIGGSGALIFALYEILIQEIPILSLDVETLSLIGLNLPMTGRIGVWQYAAEWIGNSPWFGYGYDGFWKLRQKLDGGGEESEWIPSDAHNGYFDIVLQLGFAGLAFFLVIYWIFYAIAVRRTLSKEAVPADRFALFILSFFFLANLTESYFLKATNIMQILFNAVIVSMCLARQKSTIASKVEKKTIIEVTSSTEKTDTNPFFRPEKHQ